MNAWLHGTENVCSRGTAIILARVLLSFYYYFTIMPLRKHLVFGVQSESKKSEVVLW